MTIALSWNILPKRSRAILSENGQKSETPSSHFLMIEPIQYAAVSAISKPDTKWFFVRKIIEQGQTPFLTKTRNEKSKTKTL